MDLSEKLDACLRIEMLCEEIYYAMCNSFPEAKQLFRQLAEEEERHADILTISAGFHKMDGISELIVPDSASKIKESQDLAEKMKRTMAEQTSLPARPVAGQRPSGAVLHRVR